MVHFFRQAGGDLFDGTAAYLDSLKSNFNLDQATGLIEVRASPADEVFLLFAGGESAGTYRSGTEACQPIPDKDAAEGWTRTTAPIRLLTLSDTAARAVWVALESRPRGRHEVRGPDGWTKFLDERRAEKFTGPVQVNSETSDGFVFFRGGLPVPSEAVFCTASGFETNLTRLSASLNGDIQLALAELDPGRPSGKDYGLRLGANDWGKSLLERYRDMVGQRLLQTLTDDLNTLIGGWRWKIRLTGSELVDRHFFAQPAAASRAYFTIFKGMADRIQMVLGNLLASRMMNDTFEELGQSEQQSLTTQNLTPAALAQ